MATRSGRIEIHGDLVKLLEVIYRSSARADVDGSIAHRVAGWLHRPRRNTFAGSRDNIHHHYDIGNEFYALWLGETMAYTCAYYPTRRRNARAGADRQDGSRVPQAPAEGRR